MYWPLPGRASSYQHVSYNRRLLITHDNIITTTLHDFQRENARVSSHSSAPFLISGRASAAPELCATVPIFISSKRHYHRHQARLH